VFPKGSKEASLFFFRDAGAPVAHPEADETIGLFVKA
jgi:hypothetical protein